MIDNNSNNSELNSSLSDILKFYVDQYNKLAKKHTPILAYNQLGYNATLLEKESTQLFEKRDSMSKDFLLPQSYKYNFYFYKQLDLIMQDYIGFPKELTKNKELEAVANRYFKTHFKHGFLDEVNFNDLLYTHLRYKHRTMLYATCTIVINHALNLSFPELLKLTSSQLLELEEATTNNKVGRPSTIPYDLVKEQIETVLNMSSNNVEGYSKYLKKDGSPNIRQLALYLTEQGLGVELELRSLQRTVKHVLDEYDIIDSVM